MEQINPAGPPPWFRMAVNRALEDCFSPSSEDGLGNKTISALLSAYYRQPLTGVVTPLPSSDFLNRLKGVQTADITFTFFSGEALRGSLFIIDFGRYLASPGFPLSLIGAGCGAKRGECFPAGCQKR